MDSRTRRAVLAGGVALAGVGLAGCLGDGTDQWETDGVIAAASATQIQGESCSCCGQYADYFRDHLDGSLDVESVGNQDELVAMKRDRGIPAEYQSCHTVDLDEYVFEGHLPVEAIASYLDDGPGTIGLALPGMPAGSPGMGGSQDEPFTIYELTGDGGAEPYMEL